MAKLLFLFAVFHLFFIVDCFAFSERSSFIKLKNKTIIKDDVQVNKIISSGIGVCKRKNTNIQSKKIMKKITICPIRSSHNMFSIFSNKSLFRNYYKLRNLIYIICFLFLIFIWARIYWQKLPEWKMLFSVIIVFIITTLINMIINWYILYDDVYIYHCKKPNILWQLCKKGQGSFIASQHDLIILDSNGSLLKRRAISDKFKTRYKVNMFY